MTDLSTTELNAALVAFQKTLPTIGKDNTATVPTKAGGKYTYQYADLTTITEIAFPLLAAQGLSWTTKPLAREDGKIVLRYALRHVGGGRIKGDFPLPNDTTPQSLGSAITYARRYALCAVTGIAPGGEDDDGAKASAPVKAAAVPAAPVAEPPAGWRAKITAVTTLEGLTELYETEAIHWYTDEVKLAFKGRKAGLV